MKKFIEYYTELKPYYNSKSGLCFVGVMALIVVPPITLALFQFSILYLIPPQFTLDYFHLDYNHPNISSMFFSTYVHNISSFAHLLGNYSGYVAIILLIIIFFFVIIPVLKVNKVLSLNYSEKSLFLTSAVFFFVLPFSIAGISIIFGKMVKQSGTWGFSGILWAFTSYFIFLLLEMVYDAILTKSLLNTHLKRGPGEKLEKNEIQTLNKLNIGVLLLILVSALFIITPIFVILLDLGNEKINVFAHLGGFILGLLVSILVALIYSTNQKPVRAISTVFLVIILLIPAISWIFL
ncbi:MAG: hypothetical protein WCK53_06800 [Methanomicrobiales archaeon]